ncbi:UTP--glucose-1-phosphate uridylyltransferase GalU [Rothia mucilaginosa]|jgi:UTP--glucose-1-phosphate uridylyltransferase|uniref:UTP--glucose-1-phosphate uridylyltransferase n=1 Tax=Rothia mucilaginosa TaxID=43675 RepID=A0A2I1Z6A8_9MICC|nr:MULTISPECIES: UTP--glucose-1-phosphate uridylyltransferase GalU [Rothia]EET75471.1 UTP--glucose-1-phosphate uridylyltransferase [Rothia mucilaginosa ATCC 25296]MBF1641684.1 UTP--glucose-1-phosphate uridylyltransferase GalU [Rothia mucilaginosa]MBF1660162.1 UTP--glucose-1-phosphate uridylyltransferase GalU [Rothia mucilaginosa]MBF1673934.1 UTP--glucose-1-phosphate uridylyltransferase GalU [Rothia mucilaginosa]MBS6978891.1 UTP--glucose-1-phosphate uridylyltransferase GalU [Rothia mucilaginosa
MATEIKSVTKAVIPAAGLGTRFLPATKATPKEMLPVVDRPAIQYVVEEAIRAGLNDVLMITGRNKRALEDHFDRVPVLEQQLAEQGKDALLASVVATNEMGGDLHYVRQGDPKGLGHAVLRAKRHVGDEAFAVLLGDDLIDEKEDLLARMVEVQERTGGSVVALMEVPREAISAYGAAAIEAVEGEDGFVKITGLVEKPAADEAPSNYAVIGRYVLSPKVFEVLENTAPGRGGEIQLTDALQTLAQGEGEGEGVYGVVFSGRRFDTGDKLSYLKANVILAAERPEFGDDLRAWLKDFVAENC